MGMYLNPGNSDFIRAKHAEIFVDKSEMIRYTNFLIGQEKNKICVTRPRRFGKTIDLNMLAAYYSRGCDSRALFQDLKIAQDPSFLAHLNKHYVIQMDVQCIWEDAIRAKKGDQLVDVIQDAIIDELVEEFPDVDPSGKSLAGVLKEIKRRKPDILFIFLLDEWDTVLRDTSVTQSFKKEYLSLLVSLFKGREIEGCLAMVYMTGILPPLKYLKDTKNQSWLNFVESSMLSPGALARYVGFTESEVSALCTQWNMSMDMVKEWYDGYQLGEVGSVYCPESVYLAMTNRKIENYWAGTSDFSVVGEQLIGGLPELKEAVDDLVAKESVTINPTVFRNNVNKICCKDDVLALLVHYGYLSYFEDGPEKKVRIPNSEVREEFANAVRYTETEEYRTLQKIVNRSQQLLESTWDGDEEKVAKQIQEVHDYKVSALKYNNELALQSVVNLAYFTADAYYMMIAEFPSGQDYIDIAFVPKYEKYIPMILELKWNKSAETALKQIKDRNYQGSLKHYKKILLVGISYEKGTKKSTGKKHTCKIELWEDPDQ